MIDLIKLVFKNWGVKGILCAAIFAFLVWGLAYWTAAPGKPISVLWGLVEYTKEGLSSNNHQTSNQKNGTVPSAQYDKQENSKEYDGTISVTQKTSGNKSPATVSGGNVTILYDGKKGSQ